MSNPLAPLFISTAQIISTVQPLQEMRGSVGFVSGTTAANARRQRWKLITMPTATVGSTTTMIMYGDNGFGEISSSTIPETIQSTEKHTAKSIRGTPSQ